MLLAKRRKEVPQMHDVDNIKVNVTRSYGSDGDALFAVDAVLQPALERLRSGTRGRTLKREREAIMPALIEALAALDRVQRGVD